MNCRLFRGSVEGFYEQVRKHEPKRSNTRVPPFCAEARQDDPLMGHFHASANVTELSLKTG